VSAPTGKVYLIGAGPGDPGLITVKGLECLKGADVVIDDYLANPALLEGLDATVERIHVGKRHGSHLYSQEQINEMLVTHARAGRIVARLKGGDPFIFGRGGEEAAALAAAGVPFEVVPGVTAATAVAAYAGIPLTHRGMNASVTFVTGQETPGRKETLIHWDDLGRAGGTLVFFMGVKSLEAITARLIDAGRDPDTPTAVIHWGTLPAQRTVAGRLGDIARKVAEAGLEPPALTVVGDVVSLRDRINWFESLPLFGRRVLVTRAAGQQGALAHALAARGAEVVGVPTIRIAPPEDPGPLDDAVQRLAEFHWVVLTSANGVEAFFSRLAAAGRDARALAGIRVAVVGAETARALAARGIEADLVPPRSRAEGLAEALLEEGVRGQRVLLAQAAGARRVLPELLTREGVTVTVVPAYRTVAPDPEGVDLAALERAPLDWATFTSASTVRGLRGLLGAERFARVLAGCRIAVIGPVTAEAAREAGLAVHLQPEGPSIHQLVDAICADAARPGAPAEEPKP
jgi:uroporphyrinogen III methyltransferase/synthase